MLARQQVRLRRQQLPVLDQIGEVPRRAARTDIIPQID
jgi:hypothetical protein